MKREIITMFFLLLPLAAGLGVGPSENEVVAEPGTNTTLRLLVAEPSSDLARITVKGDLAEYIKPETGLINFSGERRKTINVGITLPESLEPGPKTSRVVVTELAESDDQITAGVSVVSRITIIVPYPGKYAAAGLAQSRFKPGKESNFIVRIRNLGQERIEAAQVSIEVKGKPLEADPVAVETGEESYVNLAWKPEQRGEFPIAGVVTYDGNKTRFSGEATVGSRRVLLSAPRAELEGETLTLEIPIRNDWNSQTQVATLVEITRDGEVAEQSPSPVTTIGPYGEEDVAAVLDLGSLKGEYSLEVTATHGRKQARKEYDLSVNRGSVTFNNKTYERHRGNAQLYLSLAGIIVTILLMILWLKKRKR